MTIPRSEGEWEAVTSEARVVVVIVEIPQGSRNKYEYDADLGCFRLDRMLFSSVHYPSDYGYVKGTHAPDGDPLDAMVMVGEPTFPGCAIEARPVGMFRMWDEEGLDDKILCVPMNDPQWEAVADIGDVPEYFKREVEHFFSIYKDLQDKEVQVGGWLSATEAWTSIEDAQIPQGSPPGERSDDRR